MEEEKIPKAKYSGTLKITNLEIPCHVLEDGRRVLVQRKMVNALGMARGGSSKGGGDRLAHFVSGKVVSSFINNDLAAVTRTPSKFITPKGNIAYCYEATILADLCDAVFEANKQGKLQSQQKHIAERCEALMRGFAKVGIIALVDEATVYQEVRDKLALQKILEMYIAQELRPWIKTFQDEFYEQLFRLRGWQYKPLSVKRPTVVVKITNDLVYKRIAPGVFDELKKITPRDDKGRTKHRYFQRLSENIGYVKLKEHLVSVTTLMKASPNWSIFYRLIQRALPQYGANVELPFTDKEIEKMVLTEESQTANES
jgi:hypothetical protein